MSLPPSFLDKPSDAIKNTPRKMRLAWVKSILRAISPGLSGGGGGKGGRACYPDADMTICIEKVDVIDWRR